MTDHRKTKSNWTRPSLNDFNSMKNKLPAKSPWETREDEMFEDFERSLNAANFEMKYPWSEGSLELRQKETEQWKARTYEPPKLFKPLSPTEKERKKYAEYQIDAPYLRGVNERPRTAKKMNNGKNPNNTTRPPWAYGSLPGDPVPKKNFPHKKTELWPAPQGDSSEAPPMESSGDPVLDSLRIQLKKRGAAGIAGLARKFRIMDDDDSGTLSEQEFKKGMKENKISDLSDKAIAHLFRYFDNDDSGVISYDEFLVGIRGVMNERRKKLVHMAFNILDKDGSGQIDIDDIRGVYDASCHPDVIMGKTTEDEVLKGFIENFEVGSKQGSKDAVVTLDEFENYYSNISASVDNDDEFELMIRNAWHISGGEGWCANTTNRRVLVTHADGSQTVEEIKNDLGIKANDQKTMVNRLKAQGIEVGTINLNGIGDMENQYESEDFAKIRHDLAQMEMEEEEDERLNKKIQSSNLNKPSKTAPKSLYSALDPKKSLNSSNPSPGDMRINERNNNNSAGSYSRPNSGFSTNRGGKKTFALADYGKTQRPY